MSDVAVQFVHDERFVEPFANRPHTVLGKRLFPYSLWVHCNLEWAQSPFLLGNREPNLHDLWVAVQCASTPWTPEHYVPDLRPVGGLKRFWQVCRFDVGRELQKFEAYVEDFAVGPKLWSNHHKDGGETGSRSGLDENLELAGVLEMELKLSPREVWTMPLGQVRWRAATVNYFKGGDLQVWTPLDEARAKAHREDLERQVAARADEIIRKRPTTSRETAERLARQELDVRRAANLAAIKP